LFFDVQQSKQAIKRGAVSSTRGAKCCLLSRRVQAAVVVVVVVVVAARGLELAKKAESNVVSTLKSRRVNECFLRWWCFCEKEEGHAGVMIMWFEVCYSSLVEEHESVVFDL